MVAVWVARRRTEPKEKAPPPLLLVLLLVAPRAAARAGVGEGADAPAGYIIASAFV